MDSNARGLTAAAAGLLAALSIGAPARAVAQPYTLDDWMTVSSVGSFEWSPDGRWIYFTSNAAPSGTAEIFRIPAEGGEPVLLSRTPAGERPEPKGELSGLPTERRSTSPRRATSRRT
jgi:hypothetical protein